MSINEAVIEKLKKILARADTARGATEAEVKVALEKAKALAIEHNIDLSTVNVDGEVKVGEVEVDRGEVHISTKYERPYHNEILNVLRECFEVRPIMSSYWTAQAQRVITRITFVGEKTDLAIALYCWDWLQNLFPKCWGEYRKATGRTDSWVSSRSYYVGLRAGINEANRRQVEELPRDVRDRYALVVVDKGEKVNAKVDEIFGDTLRNLRTHQKDRDYSAMSAGQEKGRSIKLTGGLSGSSSTGRLS